MNTVERPVTTFNPQPAQTDKAAVVNEDRSHFDAAAKGKEPVKVYIATPAYGGMLHVSYVVSLLNLRALGCDFLYDVIGNESLIQRARNMLVARFLQSDCTHILFIDADIMFPPVAIQRLLQGAAAGKEVVAGAYAKKSHRWNQFADKLKRGEHKAENPEPLASMGLDYNVNVTKETVAVDDGFVRVLDTATGFMLIARSAIEKLIAAHPEWEMVNDIEHSGGPKVEKYFSIFDVIKDPVTSRCLSEDYALCRRLQELDIDIWVDFTTTLAHHGNNTFHADINSTLTEEFQQACSVQPMHNRKLIDLLVPDSTKGEKWTWWRITLMVIIVLCVLASVGVIVVGSAQSGGRL